MLVTGCAVPETAKAEGTLGTYQEMTILIAGPITRKNERREAMFGGIMKIWQILGTLIEAIVLTEVLLGRRITTLDGAMLGTAADIKLDLMRDKIWVMVEHQGQWNRISTQQIASLTNEMIVVETWMPAYLAKEAGTLL